MQESPPRRLPDDAGATAFIAHRPDGPLDAALSRTAGEAAAALDIADPVKAVHELRKSFKQLRALLRLVQYARDKAAADQARALRRALAQAARLLAAARDDAARRDALDDLVAKGGLAPALRGAAGRSLAPARGRIRGTNAAETGLAPHRAELELLLAQLIAALPALGGLSEKERLRALAAEYGRARRMARRLDPADDEALHELRKAVVAQRYQMELLTPAWPALGAAWVGELQRLRDRLGKHQDLSVLIARIEAHAVLARGQHSWRQPLVEAARARQLHLAGAALRLHARLFAEKPAAFHRRIAAYMSAISERK
ncbi:CHAD domain-containing protein [Starkeya koreensis]|uniref:CHAD domain-containing protein n=1 Tax=Ancylobacter koreensis TaxID=266121 RepID=A0ABT0DKS3_9HYPH|nr:CHAD domain-containing protein [Ancylobacter koreensis]MCK0207883.1 CHAD domain-containing protein [Ancylobacter koreensis]